VAASRPRSASSHWSNCMTRTLANT
jgi:hypothetical protein